MHVRKSANRRSTSALAKILFAVGIPWAFLAGFGISGALAGTLEDLAAGNFCRGRNGLMDFLMLASFSLLATWGYVVWLGWFRVGAGRRESSFAFWLLAAIHHLAWIGFAKAERLPEAIDAIIVWYAAAVLTACLGAAFLDRGGRRKLGLDAAK